MLLHWVPTSAFKILRKKCTCFLLRNRDPFVFAVGRRKRVRGLPEDSTAKAGNTLMDFEETVSLKEKLALYQAAVSKAESSNSFSSVRQQCFTTLLILCLLCIPTHHSIPYLYKLREHCVDSNLKHKLSNLHSKHIDPSVSVSTEWDFSCYVPLVIQTTAFNSWNYSFFYSIAAWISFIRSESIRD